MIIDRLYPLLAPLLRHLDAETAHDLAIAALERLPLPRADPDPPALRVRAFGCEFPNPVGIAAGLDKNARVPDALLRLGFGFVEVGGVTRAPQPGNPRPRVFRLPADRAIINRYGLNSEGMAAIAARLAQRPRRGVLGVNLGANKASADRIGDYAALVRSLGPYAEFLTLNISSPNTPGLRDLQGRAFLDELLTQVLAARAAAGLATRILIKIAPDLDDQQLDDIVDVACRHAIDGMIVANTTLARPADLADPVVAREAGGLSGKPLFRASTILLAKAFLRVSGRFPLVGVGGISSGEDALAKIAAGASLLQLYTGLVFSGPALIARIKDAIAAALLRENMAETGDLVGQNAAAWAAKRA